MSDEEALIAAIVGADCKTAEERRARWAEDTPRLAYADWLDEQDSTTICKVCGGSGYKPPTLEDMDITEMMTAPDGKVQRYITKKPFDFRSPSRCGNCSGTGHVSSGRKDRAELIRLQIEIKCHEGDEGPPEFKLNENPATCKRCKGWYAGLARCGCAYGDRRSTAWTKLVNDHKAWTHEFFARAARETELGRYCQDNREAFYNLPGEVMGLGDWKWERGFCNKLRIKYSDWYEHGDLILSRQPLEEVTLVLSTDFGGSRISEWEAYAREIANVQQAVHYKWIGPEFSFQPQGNGTTLRMDEWLEMDETVLRTARDRLRGIGNLPLPLYHQDFSFNERDIMMSRLDTGMLRPSIPKNIGISKTS